MATRSCVTPSRHHAGLVSNGAPAGQGNGLDVAVERSRAAQLNKHDVIVQVVVVVVRVLDDLASIDVLLGTVIGVEAVLTQTHCDAAAEQREDKSWT